MFGEGDVSGVYISGLGQISAAGQGVSSLKKALHEQLKPSPKTEVWKTKLGEREVSYFSVPEVEMPANLPESVKRRMSRFSKMCFASVAEALEDAKTRTGMDFPADRIGLVVGSAYCSLDLANLFEKKIQVEGPAGASPSLFASSVQNSIASHLSITFGIQGPCSTVVTMEQSVVGAIRLAYDWLKQDLADYVVVAIGDEISEHMRYATAHQEGAQVLGEGVVTFVLTKKDLEKTYAEIKEIGFTWLSDDQKSTDKHIDYYGEMVTGPAFEVMISALNVPSKRREKLVAQLTDHGEVSWLILGPRASIDQQ
jgi:hypothetical protein